jgi:hypothetical protein
MTRTKSNVFFVAMRVQELIALSKKPRRKGTHVENKCAARGMITVITSSCVISIDFALCITKIKKKTKTFNLV